ncbi:unnamed protein product [Linum trigynum]|uniref:Uncharacterized protein n=1 Tax=Linum trigynum TaxID=586398 RepID=A0AAV2E160_9ROSI
MDSLVGVTTHHHILSSSSCIRRPQLRTSCAPSQQRQSRQDLPPVLQLRSSTKAYLHHHQSTFSVLGKKPNLTEYISVRIRLLVN